MSPLDGHVGKGSNSRSSSVTSTTSSLSSDFLKTASDEDRRDNDGTGVPLYYKDAEYLEEMKQQRRAKRKER